jgi:hypothetical protein
MILRNCAESGPMILRTGMQVARLTVATRGVIIRATNNLLAGGTARGTEATEAAFGRIRGLGLDAVGGRTLPVAYPRHCERARAASLTHKARIPLRSGRASAAGNRCSCRDGEAGDLRDQVRPHTDNLPYAPIWEKRFPQRMNFPCSSYTCHAFRSDSQRSRTSSSTAKESQEWGPEQRRNSLLICSRIRGGRSVSMPV